MNLEDYDEKGKKESPFELEYLYLYDDFELDRKPEDKERDEEPSRVIIIDIYGNEENDR